METLIDATFAVVGVDAIGVGVAVHGAIHGSQPLLRCPAVRGGIAVEASWAEFSDEFEATLFRSLEVAGKTPVARFCNHQGISRSGDGKEVSIVVEEKVPCFHIRTNLENNEEVRKQVVLRFVLKV